MSTLFKNTDDLDNTLITGNLFHFLKRKYILKKGLILFPFYDKIVTILCTVKVQIFL